MCDLCSEKFRSLLVLSNHKMKVHNINDCKEERYCEEEVEGCLNKHYLLQCYQLFDHRNDGYGNTGHLVVIVSYILKLCDLIFSNILASF